MKKLRSNSALHVASNEEMLQDNKTFWSEYWYYFPRIEVSPYAVSGTVIIFLISTLAAIIYTIGYLIYMSLRMLVRGLRG